MILADHTPQQEFKVHSRMGRLYVNGKKTEMLRAYGRLVGETEDGLIVKMDKKKVPKGRKLEDIGYIDHQTFRELRASRTKEFKKHKNRFPRIIAQGESHGRPWLIEEKVEHIKKPATERQVKTANKTVKECKIEDVYIAQRTEPRNLARTSKGIVIFDWGFNDL